MPEGIYTAIIVERRGVSTVLCEANQRVRMKLEKAGLTLHNDGRSRYFESLQDAITKGA
jgi:hypothetical protein